MFQKYKLAHIITFFLFLAPALNVTSLTTSNCPSAYDFAAVNATADSSAETFVTLIYGGVYSSEDQAELNKAYAQGDTKTVGKYLASMKIIVPFAIIGGGFAIVFFVALCCCLFDKSCPPCQSLKRDFGARPYQKFQMNCVTTFAIIFAAAITITAIVGFVFFPALQKTIKMTKCALYYSMDVALNGDLPNGWGGFTLLANQIGNISTQLGTASTAASMNISSSEWLLADLTALQQANINLYKDNSQSTVQSPNPATTASANSVQSPLPTVVPLFISSGLGPYTANNTMTYDIHNAILNTTAVVANQGYKVFKAAQTLTNSANSIQTNTQINMQSLTMNSNYIDASTTSLNNMRSDLFDALETWALYLIQAILAFIMVGSVLTLIGVIAAHFCQVFTCKSCVHLGWVTFGLTYFGIVVMAFFLFGMGGLSYSFCQFYKNLLTDQAAYSSYANSARPTSFNRVFARMAVCFYGNGSITSSFMLRSEVQTVSQLYAQIGKYMDMRDASESAYVDLNSAPNKITAWINAIDKYRLGIYLDAAASLTTEDNPQVALAGMNKYTNNGTNGVVPTCTFDYWVYDVANCTRLSNQTIYTSSTATSGLEFAATGFLCISLNQKFSSNSSRSWSQKDIASRYLQVRQCNQTTQAYESVMSYADSIVNYRDSRTNVYQNIKDQLSALLSRNAAFNSKIAAFTGSVQSFLSATATLNTLVTNQASGVDYASNCTAVASSLRLFYNVFCVSFIYRSVQFGICCLVLLAVMVGGMLTGSVFGIRYGRIEKQKKTVMPEVPLKSDLHSQTFERRQKSSSSDSSSEED